LQNAAQKALAGEIATRATKLAEVPDRQICLPADGAIRWNGAAAGMRVAGEEPLRPRVRIIADEHLTGAPREAVEARLDKWVKSHIERLLGPLFGLAAAADISGIARGIAFQIVEALGVLDRVKVAEEVKGLPQPDRASLRKYGVRFGAYNIYLPLLLKPAPRALAAQLWALTHDGPESAGLDDLLHLAGSGRTSSPVNRQIDSGLYRVAGYRVCGERAARVDILERLADLIRPALAWREGSLGPKPAGAIAGGGFTVVNTMTSLTGASGEDFASILRSLGYRMERRAKPAEPEPASAPVAASQDVPPQEPPSADAPSEDADSQQVIPHDGDPAEMEGDPTESLAPVEPTPDTSVALDANAPQSGPNGEAGPPSVPEINAAPQSPADDTAPAASSSEPIADALTANADGGSDTPAAAEAPRQQAQDVPEPAPSEPPLIEVWRPARRPEGRRRPRFKHHGAGSHGTTNTGAE